MKAAVIPLALLWAGVLAQQPQSRLPPSGGDGGTPDLTLPDGWVYVGCFDDCRSWGKDCWLPPKNIRFGGSQVPGSDQDLNDIFPNDADSFSDIERQWIAVSGNNQGWRTWGNADPGWSSMTKLQSSTCSEDRGISLGRESFTGRSVAVYKLQKRIGPTVNVPFDKYEELHSIFEDDTKKLATSGDYWTLPLGEALPGFRCRDQWGFQSTSAARTVDCGNGTQQLAGNFEKPILAEVLAEICDIDTSRTLREAEVLKVAYQCWENEVVLHVRVVERQEIPEPHVEFRHIGLEKEPQRFIKRALIFGTEEIGLRFKCHRREFDSNHPYNRVTNYLTPRFSPQDYQNKEFCQRWAPIEAQILENNEQCSMTGRPALGMLETWKKKQKLVGPPTLILLTTSTFQEAEREVDPGRWDHTTDVDTVHDNKGCMAGQGRRVDISLTGNAASSFSQSKDCWSQDLPCDCNIPLAEPRWGDLSMFCSSDSKDAHDGSISTRKIMVRHPIMIDGLDVPQTMLRSASAGSFEQNIPVDPWFTDEFVTFNPEDWIKTDGVEVCSGVVFNNSNRAEVMYAQGHRALYLSSSETSPLFAAAYVQMVFTDGSRKDQFFMRFETPLASNHSPVELQLIGAGLSISIGDNTYEEQLELPNFEPGTVVEFALKLRPQPEGRLKVSMSAKITIDDKNEYPWTKHQLVDNTYWDGVPLMFSFGSQGVPQLQPVEVKKVRLNTQARTMVECCGSQETHHVKMLKAGDFGAPDFYQPPEAECIHITSGEGPSMIRAMSFYHLKPSTSSVSTSTVGDFHVQYECKHDDLTYTKSLFVQVRSPLELIGSASVKVTMNQLEYQDQGAKCMSPTGEDLGEGSLTMISRVSMSTAGFYTVTWKCIYRGQTLTVDRTVEVTSPIILYGPNPFSAEHASDYIEFGGRCVSESGITSQAQVSYTKSGSTVSDVKGGGTGLYIAFYVCAGTSITQTRTIIITTEEPMCNIRGLGFDRPKFLAVHEAFEDPKVCCYAGGQDSFAISDAEASSGELVTDSPGSLLMVYHCDIGSKSTSCSRQVQVNSAPTIYLLGQSEIRHNLEQPYEDAGVVCIDVEDGSIGPKTYMSRIGQLPIIRGTLKSESQLGTVESLFDGDMSCVGHNKDYRNKLSQCFMGLKVTAAQVITLDLGSVRMVSKVSLRAYAYQAPRSDEINGQAKAQVVLIHGDQRMRCQPDGIKMMNSDVVGEGVATQCTSAFPARFLEVSVDKESYFCEVEVYGRDGPRPAAMLRLNVACSGTSWQQTVQTLLSLSVGEYLCQISVDQGAKGNQYTCTGSLDWNKGQQLLISREGAGKEPFVVRDKWFLKCIFNGELKDCATAIGGSNIVPSGTSWSDVEGSSCSIEVDALDADCGSCELYSPKWPSAACSVDEAACSAHDQQFAEEPPIFEPKGIETVSGVQTMEIGRYVLTHTCVDSFGAMASVSRTVLVGCEEPNVEDEVFGGNKLACEFDNRDETTLSFDSWEDCANSCAQAGVMVCTAYEWDNRENEGKCIFHYGCTGDQVYEEDLPRDLDLLAVGYCRRTNSPPQVLLSAVLDYEYDTENVFAIFPFSTKQQFRDKPLSCQCDDLEDAIDPQCTSDWREVVDEASDAGIYSVNFTCVDSKGLLGSFIVDLILTANCPLPDDENRFSGGLCSNLKESYEFGDECEIRCKESFNPRYNFAECQLVNPMDVQPIWGPGDLNFTSEWCGPAPCLAGKLKAGKTMLTGVANLLDPLLPCKGYEFNETEEAQIVPHDAICEPRCDRSYASLKNFVTCWQGSFDQDFQCKKISAGISQISINASIEALHLSWQLNTASCDTPKALNLQGAILGHKDGPRQRLSEHDWATVAGEGCSPEEMAVTLERSMDDIKISSCAATGLLDEDGTEVPFVPLVIYKFRMKESCFESVLSSGWTPSIDTKLHFVPLPKISFRIPLEDDRVLSSPELVVALFEEKVQIEKSSSAKVSLERLDSPGCDGIVYAVEARDVTDQSVTALGTAGLSNEQILMVTPDDGMWEPSCKYSFTIEAGLMRTVAVPPKVNEELSWNFSWDEVGPVQQNLQALEKVAKHDGIEAKYSIKYNSDVNFTCFAQAVRSNEQIFAKGWGRLHRGHEVGDIWQQPLWEVPPMTTTGRFFADADEVTVFKFRGLVPSADYDVWCHGHKPARWWVTTECQNGQERAVCPKYRDSMIPDIMNELDHVNFTKYAICTNEPILDISHFQNYMQNLKVMSGPIRSPLVGQLFQVGEWERLCDATLEDGDFAYLRLHVAAAPKHQFASVYWRSGPWVDIMYEKSPLGAVPKVVSKQLDMQIYSHSDTVSARSLSAVVAAVYGTIAIAEVTTLDLEDGVFKEKDVISSQVTTELEVGTWVQVRIEAADAGVTMSSFGITLGDSAKGFMQECTHDQSKFAIIFKFVAQGYGLPLKISWMMSDFPTDYTLSAAPPFLSVPDQKSMSLTSGEPSFFAQFNYPPGVADLMITSNATIAPEDIFRLSVRKVNTTFTGSDLALDNPVWEQAWTQVRYRVKKAPLEDLEVILKVRDFREPDLFQEIELSKRRDKLGFANLQVAQLGADLTSTKDYQLQLSAYTMAAVQGEAPTLSPYMYIHGVNFPTPLDVILDEAEYKNYEFFLVGNDDAKTLVPLCKSVTFKTVSSLECELIRCLDARILTTYPAVVLKFGDFTSASQTNLIELPTPVIDQVEPSRLNDTGEVTVVVTGRYFGLRMQANETLPQACDRTESSEHFGLIRMFGAIDMNVGNARCKVFNQTETQVMCNVTTAVREARSQAKSGEQRGDLLFKQRIVVSMTVGMDVDVKTPFQLDTILVGCPDGQRRIVEERTECELCPPGQFARDGEDQSPLQCTLCPETAYQDLPGGVDCKACPENTIANGLMATRREDCVCAPGYYSPVWTEDKRAALPGYPCKSCSNADFVATPPRGVICGRDIKAFDQLCIEDLSDVCVRAGVGSLDNRVCKVFCPGGVHLPMAKPQYFITGQMAVSGTTGDRKQEYRPEAVRCEPVGACASRNRCAVGYTGEACQDCVFGYFRDRLNGNICKECDDSAVTGTIIMTGASVVLTLGAFFCSLLYMKTLSDPIFKHQAESLVKRTLLMLLAAKKTKQRNLSRGWSDYIKHRRYTINLTRRDVGTYFKYYRNGDLGMIIRIDDDMRCHVAGLKKGSPARIAGVQKGWELRLVNGRRIKAHTELEVFHQLATAKLPMVLMFKGSRTWRKDTNEEEQDGVDLEQQAELGQTAYDTLRMATMTLSILQSFNAVARLDLDWPPVFKLFSAIIANITLDFSFFHPECSVESPYELRWLGFLMIPYAVIGSITLAFLVMRTSLTCTIEMSGELRLMNEWLLKNAWNRAALSVLLIFVQNHMELLWSPFSCFERDDGKSVMLNAQEVVCDLRVDQYFRIWLIAVLGWALLSCIYAVLLWCMYKAYFWQTGPRIRNKVPAYVAAIEMSASGMKGFSPLVGDRVFFNIVAPMTYPADSKGNYFKHQTLKISERNMDFRVQGDDEDEWGNLIARPRKRPFHREEGSDDSDVDTEVTRDTRATRASVGDMMGSGDDPSASLGLLDGPCAPGEMALSMADPQLATDSDESSSSTESDSSSDDDSSDSDYQDPWDDWYNEYGDWYDSDEEDDSDDISDSDSSDEDSSDDPMRHDSRRYHNRRYDDRRISSDSEDDEGEQDAQETSNMESDPSEMQRRRASEEAIASAAPAAAATAAAVASGTSERFHDLNSNGSGSTVLSGTTQTTQKPDSDKGEDGADSMGRSRTVQSSSSPKTQKGKLKPSKTSEMGTTASISTGKSVASSSKSKIKGGGGSSVGASSRSTAASAAAARQNAPDGDGTRSREATRSTGLASRRGSQRSEANSNIWPRLLALFGVEFHEECGISREEWRAGFDNFASGSNPGVVTSESFRQQRFLKHTLFSLLDSSRSGEVDHAQWDVAFDSLADEDGFLYLEDWTTGGSPVSSGTAASPRGAGSGRPGTGSHRPGSGSGRPGGSGAGAGGGVGSAGTSKSGKAKVLREEPEHRMMPPSEEAPPREASAAAEEEPAPSSRPSGAPLSRLSAAPEGEALEAPPMVPAASAALPARLGVASESLPMMIAVSAPPASGSAGPEGDIRASFAPPPGNAAMSAAAVASARALAVKAKRTHVVKIQEGNVGKFDSLQTLHAGDQVAPVSGNIQRIKTAKSFALGGKARPKKMLKKAMTVTGDMMGMHQTFSRKQMLVNAKRAHMETVDISNEDLMSPKAKNRKKRKEHLKSIVGFGEAPREHKVPPGKTVVTTTEVQKDVLLAQDTFKEWGSIRWPDKLKGNFLSYGWVLLVNNFGRTFLLLATISMTASIPPIAASGQATVFFINFGLILFIMPYSNRYLSLQEALLIGCLALLVWGASFRDLLQNHRRAQDYPDTVEFVGNLIDIIVMILVIVLGLGVLSVVVQLLMSVFQKESTKMALNRAYAYRRRSMEKAADAEQQGTDNPHAGADWFREEERTASMVFHLTQFALEIQAFQQSQEIPTEDMRKMQHIFKWMLTGGAPEAARAYGHMNVQQFARGTAPLRDR